MFTEKTHICLKRTQLIVISSTTDSRVTYLGRKWSVRSANPTILYRNSLKFGERLMKIIRTTQENSKYISNNTQKSQVSANVTEYKQRNVKFNENFNNGVGYT
jgi:hypothetical protein